MIQELPWRCLGARSDLRFLQWLLESVSSRRAAGIQPQLQPALPNPTWQLHVFHSVQIEDESLEPICRWGCFGAFFFHLNFFFIIIVFCPFGEMEKSGLPIGSGWVLRRLRGFQVHQCGIIQLLLF